MTVCLSDPPATVCGSDRAHEEQMTTMSYSPWGDLTRRPHLTVKRVALPEGMWGWTDGHVILLDETLGRVEARCTLAHELAHIDLGHLEQHGADSGRMTRRQEVEADTIAALRLIDFEDLERCHLADLDEEAMAVELDVDVHFLRNRMSKLHELERVFLAMSLQANDHVSG